MDKCFNKEVCSILKIAEEEMMNLKHPYVGTEHLLLALLKQDNIFKICHRFNLTYQKFKTTLISIIGYSSKKSEVILYTPLLKQVIDEAYNNAYDDHSDLNELYLFSALLNGADGIALKIVDTMGVDIKELIKEINRPVLINELGVNLNEKTTDGIYLRDEEIGTILEILLRKNKNNPILVGHAGVGKTAIIEELAKRIKEKKVPEKLLNKEIILINTSILISGTKYRGEFEERVNNLVKEVIQNKNIILFIDEIHTLIKTGASDGSIDAGNILKPYLARGELSVIGATTTEEYNEYFKKDSALARRFAVVPIKEPSLLDMEYILSQVKKNYEDYYKLKINEKVIKYLIKECDKYLPNNYNPDKCIDILDTAFSKKTLDNYYNQKNQKYINDQDITNIISKRINLNKIDNKKLDILFSGFKNQYDETILKNIVNYIKNPYRNSFVILEGQNNDEKITILNKIALNLDVNIINIDCKEYNDEYNLNKLLNNNYLYNKLAENPYSFLIFNNYDDSNKILYNIINVILNKKYITNNNNEKIYLNNILIFVLDNKCVNNIGFNNVNNLLLSN